MTATSEPPYLIRGIVHFERWLVVSIGCIREGFLRVCLRIVIFGVFSSIPSLYRGLEMRSSLIVVSVVTVITFVLVGCAASTSQNRPSDEMVPADFAEIYDGEQVSDSVVLVSGRQESLESILVSPNVVMESSRSSLGEPETHGPDGAGARSPYLKDALGHSVDTWASTLLLSHLRNEGVDIITPARSFLACGQSECGSGTWLERVAQIYGRFVEKQPDEDSDDDTPFLFYEEGINQQEGETQDAEEIDLPTSALGVRSLGVSMARVRVRVVDHGDHVQLKPDLGAGDSICPDMVLPVPVVTFEGEILELETGQLLARVFERYQPSGDESLRVDVAERRHVPITIFRTQYVGNWLDNWDAMSRSERDDLAGRINHWAEVDTLCDSIVDEALQKYTRLREELEMREQRVVQDLIENALDSWPW